ncbi:MAG: electron transport complex subunit RsxB [Nitrosomonadaceae bacterium]
MLIEKIDAILPQTQCGQCGFPGCKPYAIAISEGHADINQCPPGNEEGIQKLADLLGVKPKPLNTAHGLPKPKSIAFIDEQICIGCTFCIQACPVDAIVGAAKKMHTVISTECTGCELCIAPCPVDCISMLPLRKQIVDAEYEPYLTSDKMLVRENEMKKKAADRARVRYEHRLKRLEYEKEEKAERLAKQTKAIKSFYVTSATNTFKKQQSKPHWNMK